MVGFRGSTNYVLGNPGKDRRYRPFVSNTVGAMDVDAVVVGPCDECTVILGVLLSRGEVVETAIRLAPVRVVYVPRQWLVSGGSI